MSAADGWYWREMKAAQTGVWRETHRAEVLEETPEIVLKPQPGGL
jgi:hypothetical protein